MLYENINNAEELESFIKKLNELPHTEQYKLFHFIFNKHIFHLRVPGFPVTKNTHYQQWFFDVGEFTAFATMKINCYNWTENPHLKSGAYEKFYFNLDPNDFQGISQNIL